MRLWSCWGASGRGICWHWSKYIKDWGIYYLACSVWIIKLRPGNDEGVDRSVSWNQRGFIHSFQAQLWLRKETWSLRLNEEREDFPTAHLHFFIPTENKCTHFIFIYLFFLISSGTPQLLVQGLLAHIPHEQQEQGMGTGHSRLL